LPCLAGHSTISATGFQPKLLPAPLQMSHQPVSQECKFRISGVFNCRHRANRYAAQALPAVATSPLVPAP
jgi:hypothetical protein